MVDEFKRKEESLNILTLYRMLPTNLVGKYLTGEQELGSQFSNLNHGLLFSPPPFVVPGLLGLSSLCVIEIKV